MQCSLLRITILSLVHPHYEANQLRSKYILKYHFSKLWNRFTVQRHLLTDHVSRHETANSSSRVKRPKYS